MTHDAQGTDGHSDERRERCQQGPRKSPEPHNVGVWERPPTSQRRRAVICGSKSPPGKSQNPITWGSGDGPHQSNVVEPSSAGPSRPPEIPEPHNVGVWGRNQNPMTWESGMEPEPHDVGVWDGTRTP